MERTDESSCHRGRRGCGRGELVSSNSIQPRLDGSTAPAATSSEQRSALESMLADLRVRHWRPGSMLGASVGSAMEALWANRGRSMLTALGIFIGVAAVIAALTLTQGASALINDRISTLGTNTIVIAPGSANNRGVFGGAGSTQSLTPDDAAALNHIMHVTGVSPILSVSDQIVYSNQNWSRRIQGVSTAVHNIKV